MNWDFYFNFTLHVANLCFFAVVFRKADVFIKILALCILITCLTEAYAAKLMIKKVDNNFLYHFLIPIQYVLYSLAYAKILRGRVVKKVVVLFLPIFLIFAIAMSLYVEKVNEYNSIVCATKHFLITFLVLFYFLQIFFEKEEIVLWKSPHFWISIGLVISSLGNFFIEGLMSYMINLSNDFALSFYLIGVGIVYFYYGTVFVALSICFKGRKSK
jgi:hypothetical protein